jgi:hypothetical protein
MCIDNIMPEDIGALEQEEALQLIEMSAEEVQATGYAPLFHPLK